MAGPQGQTRDLIAQQLLEMLNRGDAGGDQGGFVPAMPMAQPENTTLGLTREDWFRMAQAIWAGNPNDWIASLGQGLVAGYGGRDQRRQAQAALRDLWANAGGLGLTQQQVAVIQSLPPEEQMAALQKLIMQGEGEVAHYEPLLGPNGEIYALVNPKSGEVIDPSEYMPDTPRGELRTSPDPNDPGWDIITERQPDGTFVEVGRERSRKWADEAIEDAAGGPIEAQAIPNVGFDADGNPLGPVRFNKSTGEYQVMTADGGWRDMVSGETIRPPGTASPLNQNQFFRLQADYNTEYGALTKLNRYLETQGDTSTGIRRWADAISANFKTLVGSGELDTEELALEVASGQVQALLGLFREDIVGPGVMTEFDAKRVLAALGGDVSALQNPEVLATLLYDIYQSKLRRVQLLQQQLEMAAPFHSTGSGVSTPPSFTEGEEWIFNPETGELERVP